MLSCSKCGGRVLIDRTYSQGSHLELSCINCGKGWMLNKEKSSLARWLIRQEAVRSLALSDGS
jgi:hypothetical protein